MSAMFTEHAVENMRQRDVSQSDLVHLLETVERVANNPIELTQSGDVVRVGRRRGENTFIVRAGDMRALISVKPEQVIVMNVYRADMVEREKEASEPGHIAT
jgi:hypothetical protein